MWMLVALGLAFGLLVWIRESGPDDPEPPTKPMTGLRRRQVDGVANGKYRRR